jgi:hypothetical protein
MKYLVPALCSLLLAGAALAAPASAQPQQQQQCLRQNMVNGWKVVDDRTLIVDDRVGRKYIISLAKGCHDLNWPMRMGFTSSSGFGLGCIERNDFVSVPANEAYISQRCLINDVQPYTGGTPSAYTEMNHR